MIKLAAILFAIGVFLIWSAPAQANHYVYLPLVPNTPLIKSIKATQEYSYCLNARAANYPQFAAQMVDVVTEYQKRTGMRFREVPGTFETSSAALASGCQVWNSMPENHACSGCGAWVFYANWPVTVEYRWQTGYVDWRSTIGHELGHALLGLHEQYIDSGGTIQCDASRTDTVMSCGTGIRYPTARDVKLGCDIIQVAWCGIDPSLPPLCTTIGYDPCTARWYFLDGWSYDPITAIWWNPKGTPEWTACNADRLRWNIVQSLWIPTGDMLFDPARGYWAYSGPC